MKLISIIGAIFFCLNLFAVEISVDRLMISFDNNESKFENLMVTNLSPHTGYVELELYEILDSGNDSQSRVVYMQNDETTEEGKKRLDKFKSRNIKVLDPKDAGIIFAPQKLVIDGSNTGNNKRFVRIINRNKNIDKERVYRLMVKPVISDFEKGEAKIGIKILMAYEPLIFVQPENPIKNFEVSKENNKIIVKNNGNVNVYMRNIEVCNDERCEKTNSIRVYPNQEKEIIIEKLENFNLFKAIREFGNDKKLININL